jgi:transposase
VAPASAPLTLPPSASTSSTGTRRQGQRHDTVFVDNLRTHKIAGAREAIEAVGAPVRYLPAYSPNLNPIEQAFSRLKAALRKGATRTVDALHKLIGKLVKSFAPQMCANYFRHAGYTRRSTSCGKCSSRRRWTVCPRCLDKMSVDAADCVITH